MSSSELPGKNLILLSVEIINKKKTDFSEITEYLRYDFFPGSEF